MLGRLTRCDAQSTTLPSRAWSAEHRDVRWRSFARYQGVCRIGLVCAVLPRRRLATLTLLASTRLGKWTIAGSTGESGVTRSARSAATAESSAANGARRCERCPSRRRGLSWSSARRSAGRCRPRCRPNLGWSWPRVSPRHAVCSSIPPARIWVSDALKGFCRVTEPSGSTPGAIESEHLPRGCGQQRRQGPGAPGRAGARRPDARQPRAAVTRSPSFRIPPRDLPAVIRARWSPSSRTFSYGGTLTLFGGDLRPTAVPVGADLNAYVVFERARSIVRIIDPKRHSRHPTVGFVASGGARAVAAGGADSSGRVLLYIAEARRSRSTCRRTAGRGRRHGLVRARCGRAAHVRPGHRHAFAGTATATASGGDTIKRVRPATGRSPRHGPRDSRGSAGWRAWGGRVSRGRPRPGGVARGDRTGAVSTSLPRTAPTHAHRDSGVRPDSDAHPTDATPTATPTDAHADPDSNSTPTPSPTATPTPPRQRRPNRHRHRHRTDPTPTPTPPPGPVVPHDFSGDGKADVWRWTAGHHLAVPRRRCGAVAGLEGGHEQRPERGRAHHAQAT